MTAFLSEATLNHKGIYFCFCCSVAKSCLTLCNPMDCSTLSLPVHHQLTEFTQNSCPLSHWCHPTISSSVVPFSSPLPSIFSSIRVFSKESVLRIRWPKYWSFSFSISPFSEYLGLISFRMDWLDFLTVQGILKSILQHHNSRASVLCHSAFFMVQLSLSIHDYWINHSLLSAK